MKASTFKKLLKLRDDLLSAHNEISRKQEDRHAVVMDRVDQELDHIREKALDPLFTYEKEEVIPYPNPTSEGRRTFTHWAHDDDFNIWKNHKFVGRHPKGNQHPQNGHSKSVMTRSRQRITSAVKSYSCPPEVRTTLNALSDYAQLILEVVSDECARDSTEKDKTKCYLEAFENVGE